MVSANVSLPTNAYVPVLKAKRAELDAVSTAPPAGLVPLLEFVEPSTAADALAKFWKRPEHVVWAHVLNPDEIDDAQFSNALVQMYESLRRTTLAVPVLTATEEPATLSALAEIVHTDGRGAVIRVDAEDLADEDVDTASDFDATLRALEIASSDVDLFVDAGTLSGSPTIQASVAGQAIRELPHTQWRSIVVGFSAFPEALSKIVPKESVVAIARTDAAAFVATRQASGLPLVYSDYAIGIPTYGGVPFTPIPNIRYASDSEWYVHRGRERKNPAPQYRALAAEIVAAPYYAGEAFSPGDRQINDVATEISGPGNATTHLRAGMSRHLHLVLSRLANHGEP